MCRPSTASPGPSPVRWSTCRAARPPCGVRPTATTTTAIRANCGGRRRAAALEAPRSKTPTNSSELPIQTLKTGHHDAEAPPTVRRGATSKSTLTSSLSLSAPPARRRHGARPRRPGPARQRAAPRHQPGRVSVRAERVPGRCWWWPTTGLASQRPTGSASPASTTLAARTLAGPASARDRPRDRTRAPRRGDDPGHWTHRRRPARVQVSWSGCQRSRRPGKSSRSRPCSCPEGPRPVKAAHVRRRVNGCSLSRSISWA